MQWIEFRVFTTTQGAEGISEILHSCGANGTIVQDRLDVDQYGMYHPAWEQLCQELLDAPQVDVCVTAYFPDDADGQAHSESAQKRVEALKIDVPDMDWGSCRVERGTVQDEDWQNSYKQYYKPMRIGKNVVIVPEWETYTPADGDKIVWMEPGAAFGTGQHETTQLCIQVLEKYIKNGMSLLDIGCGSGILFITANLLGAEKVAGVDIDPLAVKTARDNARLNHMPDKVFNVRFADPLETPPDDIFTAGYDIVVANIVADVIIPLTLNVPAMLNPGGVFVCSGIYYERIDDVRAALDTHGFDIIETFEQGQWLAIASRPR